MNQQELFKVITLVIESEGLTRSTEYMNHSDRQAWYFSGNELQKSAEPSDPNPKISGYCLELRLIYKHNNSESDVNYLLDIIQWKNNTGHSVEKLKILHTQSQKTIEKKVRNFVNTYLSIIK